VNHSPHFRCSGAVQRHIVYPSAISVPISAPISTAHVTFLPTDGVCRMITHYSARGSWLFVGILSSYHHESRICVMYAVVFH